MKNNLLEEIKIKISKDRDPLVRILKENADCFSEYICLQINEAITVKNVQIQTSSGRIFPAGGLNIGIYRLIKVCIWTIFK